MKKVKVWNNFERSSNLNAYKYAFEQRWFISINYYSGLRNLALPPDPLQLGFVNPIDGLEKCAPKLGYSNPINCPGVISLTHKMNNKNKISYDCQIQRSLKLEEMVKSMQGLIYNYQNKFKR